MNPREMLETLPRTDDGTPATRRAFESPACTVWVVEPGNGTRYTVTWRSTENFAVAQVGGDSEKPQATARTGYPAFTLARWHHKQDRDICLYLAGLAAGNVVDRPYISCAGLAPQGQP